MALPAYPNAISFSDIQSGFATSVKSFSDLYQKDTGPVYTGQQGYPYGVLTNIPTSGVISMANFSNATPYIPGNRLVSLTTAGIGSWTVPTTLTGDITVSVIGAGGGGAGWPSECGGGGGGGGSVWVGRPAAGTVISYLVGAGGTPGPAGGSGAAGGNSSFGTSGQSWYISATGGGGGIASGGSFAADRVRAVGGTGNYGTGGSGASRYSATPPTSAVNLGGGGGASDNGCSRGVGAGAGFYGGAGGCGRSTGQPSGGGGGGGDGGSGGYGANGGVYITGVW